MKNNFFNVKLNFFFIKALTENTINCFLLIYNDNKKVYTVFFNFLLQKTAMKF